MNIDHMITGRFHFNGDIGITVEERVKRAAICYLDKTGSCPNRAHVNPKICNQPLLIEFKGHPITVVPDPTMLHYITWIGVGKVEQVSQPQLLEV